MNIENEKDVLFYEKQRFTQVWLWVIIIGVFTFMIGLLLFGMYKQIIEGEQFGTKPMSDMGLVITTVLTVLMAGLISWLFYRVKLFTIVKNDGIYVRFYPFHGKFKSYKWEEIDKLFIRKYRPLLEYGGWGLRYGFKGGKAFNVSGDMGLQVVSVSGKKILIGTNKPSQLEEVLAELKQIKT